MMIKAKERGDGPQLARYLLTMRDNEHVELHEVRGFVSDDLLGALGEADAIARGTRCQNYLFSVSLNPPEGAQVSTEAFEQVADQVERKLGLEGQPRAIVFHEKDGRRHAHVVWSRIDTQRMRAINLSHYKAKLRDVSRQLFLDHGWDMPRGLQDKRLRDPLNFTRAEWQQAKRAGLNPKEIKAIFQQAWKLSDSKAAFAQALKERGFWLAKGDRRDFVAIDYRGEAYAIARYTGIRTKEVQDKLGDPNQLRSAEEIKTEIAQGMTRKLEELIQDVEKDAKRRLLQTQFRKTEMVGRHQEERRQLTDAHEKRWLAETNVRAERLPKGFSGIWHRLTGRYAKVKAQNEREAFDALLRDRTEKDSLIFKQIEERQTLQRDIKIQRSAAQEELLELRKDVARYQSLERDDKRERKREKRDQDEDRKRQRRRSRQRRGYEP